MRYFLMILSCLFLSSYVDQSVYAALPSPFISGELVVLTRQGTESFYQDQQGNYGGLEYDLLQQFALQQGWRLKLLVAPENELIGLLEQGKAHIIAAGLAITPARQQRLQFALPYQRVRQQIIYHTDSPKPNQTDDLLGKKIFIQQGSGYSETLHYLRQKYKKLVWDELEDTTPDALVEKVANREVDYVVLHSHLVELAKQAYPDVAAAFHIGPLRSLAWALPLEADIRFLNTVNQFFTKLEQAGTLKYLLDKYYGHSQRLDGDKINTFLDKRENVLPKFRNYFLQAERLSGLDWRLLAAMAFQESAWDGSATSEADARGMMMLTSETADRMGVSDRFNVKQNILAGARYLAKLRDLVPMNVPEPDRTWMAIAAYNAGFGHFEDARDLARQYRLNPDLWVSIRRTFLMLSQARYFTKSTHGFMRGGETVIFTENVRAYYALLQRFEKEHGKGKKGAWQPWIAPSVGLKPAVSRRLGE